MASIPTALLPTAPAPAVAPKSKTTKPKTVTKATGAAGTQAKVKKPASRKKSTTAASTQNKTNSATAAQTAFQQAKAAQADLARQKAQAEARRLDPLWYRMEDLLVTGDITTTSTTISTVLPEQAQLVEQVLATYGLGPSDVTPQAMTCLLEQSRRFANELIGHAQDFAFSANRVEVLDIDLKLAAKMRPDFRVAVSAQIPKLNQLAQQVNREPLPPIPSHCYSGVVLPPKEHQLTARTYDVVSGARVQRKMMIKVPQAPKSSSAKKKVATPPSYGATKGRHIPIQLKTVVAMDDVSPVKAGVEMMATTESPAAVLVVATADASSVIVEEKEGVALSNPADVPPPPTTTQGMESSSETVGAPSVVALDSSSAPSVVKDTSAPPLQDPVPMDTTTTVELSAGVADTAETAAETNRNEEAPISTLVEDVSLKNVETTATTAEQMSTSLPTSTEPASAEEHPTVPDELEPLSMDLN